MGGVTLEITNWMFEDKPNVMVITTKNIILNGSPILSIWHDSDDGMWQFLDGTSVSEEDAMIVSLADIVEMDNSVNEVSDLPLGWVAWRTKKGLEWNRQKQNA